MHRQRFHRKTKKNDENKIHLKIITNENGKVVEIDTVFDAKDKEAAKAFMETHNMKMEIGDDEGKQIFMYKSDDMNEDEIEKVEKARGNIEKEIEQFHREMDSLNFKTFSFNFKMPDETELKALEKKMKELKFDFKFDMPGVPELPELPAMPEMKWDTEGMSPEEKAKFDAHMQKALEEMQKAFDMMKDSGKFKMQFNFDDNKDDGSFNQERNSSDVLAIIAREKGDSENTVVSCKIDAGAKNKSCSKVMVICTGDNSNDASNRRTDRSATN